LRIISDNGVKRAQNGKNLITRRIRTALSIEIKVYANTLNLEGRGGEWFMKKAF